MSILLGRRIHGENTSIFDILEKDVAQDDIIVEGEVFGIESREVRGGNFMHKGAIYDGTTSMYFQFFFEQEIKLQDGNFYRLQGKTEKNQYTRGEFVLMVENIVEVEGVAKNVRMDILAQKKIELQLFSKMSQLRGVAHVKNSIKRAKEWGHKAIAITDKGVVQAYPEAYKAAKENDIKLIFGMTANLIDDEAEFIVTNPFDAKLDDLTYVVYDVETTGFSNMDDHLIELGATKFKNGEAIESFQRFIKTPKPIPPHIEELTGISNQMVETEGVTLDIAIEEFTEFWGEAVLVAHNAQFDRDFLITAYKRTKQPIPSLTIIDTLLLSRTLNTDLKSHGLNKLSKRYKIKLNDHHRADQDAEATGYIFMQMVEQMKEHGVETLEGINKFFIKENYYLHHFPNEITIWVKNEEGLKNLYRLVSISHTEFLRNGEPTITKKELAKYREGLIIGSGSHLGKLFSLALDKTPDQALKEAEFYDVIELQPAQIAEHLVRSKKVEGNQSIERAWKTIYKIGKKLDKLMVATGHVHYLDPENELYHNILLYNEKAGLPHHMRRGRIEEKQGLCHFRTTEETLEAFSWLPEEERMEIVVHNTHKISEECEMVQPIPSDLYTPKIDGADDELRSISYERAKQLYGNPLPEYVEARLEKELTSIIKHGFSVIYLISAKLVKQSNERGYLVGSRGSVGSSFVATMSGITEVNPLKPHYRCSKCQWHMFFDNNEVQSGYDLPYNFKNMFNKDLYSEEAREYFKELFIKEFDVEVKEIVANHEDGCCPKCKEKAIVGDGHDIPFETFLGFKGDKVPDIDLNFSGDDQAIAHKDVEIEFGAEYVYRAGTVGTVAERTAFGYTKAYAEENGIVFKSNAEVARIASNIVGVKRTTGQHPGGMLVVPSYKDVHDFTPFQHPANKPENGVRTSHFDFHSIHDQILKLDILGHDNPTILRLLQDATGIDPKSLPPTDPKVMKLFYDPEEALGINLNDIKADTGTLGVPELGTEFVQRMVLETKPRTFTELVKLSGLSHGTDVWTGNAQDLIKEGICTLMDVIDTRDNIMVYLMSPQIGMEPSLAFTIMESVRKGKGLKPEWIEEMKKHNVPDWYIDSCLKIKYMFPKAHAAAYILDALRVSWHKIYRPIQFYACTFSARHHEEDITELMKSPEEIRTRIDELEKEIGDKKKTNTTTQKEEGLRKALNLALEMKIRGFEFGKVDIYKSHSKRYRIIDNKLIPPFSAVPGIGGTAADKLFEEAQKEIFRGVDELKERSGVTKTTIEVLRQMGCLKLIEAQQHTFY